MQAVKLPVPPKAARQTKRAEIVDIFSIAKAKTPVERCERAQRLMAAARTSEADAAAQFELLNVAREQAVAGGDLTIAFDAIDLLAARFDFDDQLVRVSSLRQAINVPSLPAAKRQLIGIGIELVEQRMAADAFDDALELNGQLITAARSLRDNALTKALIERGEAIRKNKASYDAVDDSLANLKISPNDADSHLAVGRYLAFAKKDWTRGLSHLAQGSDPTLKGLAQLELKRERTVGETLALADGWWSAAETADEQRTLQRRAVAHYRAVSPHYRTGLTRVRIDQCLAQAAFVDAVPRDAVLLLTFEEASLVRQDDVTFVRDHSGWENHGRFHGGQLGEGVAGQGFVIAKAGECVACANTRTLQLTHAFTISAWLKASAPPVLAGDIVSKDEWEGGTPRGFVLRTFPDGHLNVNIGNGKKWSGISSPGAVDVSGWTHMAGTFDTQSLTLYRNGKMIGQTKPDTPLTPSGYSLTIGRGTFDSQRAFIGTIDEVAIFARALSSAEVRQLHQAGADGLRLVK